MAAHDGLALERNGGPKTLRQSLSEVLPEGANFKLYHVSTPPTSTSALYSAPPGQRPDRTYCESNFLAVSISLSDKDSSEASDEVLVFAIEILIYSTAYSTTLFVSKADSSGYLHLLNLPKGSPSPLKEISSTFLAYLVERRRRPGIQTIVSLFARAQDQYLFARSIHNKRKHVLDDRGLVKWWCRILDPLLTNENNGVWQNIHGYLTVPGLDTYEAQSILPPTTTETKNWTIGHPLEKISRFSEAPPRCLIPHFPDDPKSRFLDELDDELSGSQGKENGQWTSVKDLDTFWEMMSFRQECSAGRLVGFIWIVFAPTSQPGSPDMALSQGLDSQVSLTSENTEDDDTLSESPRFSGREISPDASVALSCEFGSPTKGRTVPILVPPSEAGTPSNGRAKPPSPQPHRRARKTPTLSGPIVPRQPRVKTHSLKHPASKLEHTPYYVWPADSRGQVVLEEKDYHRFLELLLCLDFANLDLAREATKRWTSEVLAGSSTEAHDWGTSVVGARAVETKSSASRAGVTTLNLGLVRKRRKGGDVEGEASAVGRLPEPQPQAAQVNVLGAGMVRKKAKSASRMET